VRASGKNLNELAHALFGSVELKPRHASYIPFTNADGSIIDQGIAIYFKGPHSYTGEDVLELQGHGGPIVLQMLLRACCRPARISACAWRSRANSRAAPT
jgi:tRNA modification GTPase